MQIKNLSHLEKLDEVLKFFGNDNKYTKEDFANKIFERFDISPIEVIIIFRKLRKDGYVDNESGYWYRTFEGNVFSDFGGYGQQIINRNAENTRLDKNRDRAKGVPA